MSNEPTKAGTTAQWGDLPSARTKAGTVIVALDGSVHGLAALPVARTLAAVAHATLRILHIAKGIQPPQELLRKLGLVGEEVRGSIIDQVQGDPAEAILRGAREQQNLCIVLCTHTGAERPAGELGRVARQVTLAAPCPVVLVPPTRGQGPMELRHVLLPYDGTPTTAVALGFALEHAEKAGAEVTVLHVATAGVPRPTEPGTFAAPQYLDQPHHEWPAWSHELLQRVCCLAHAGEVPRLRFALAAGEPGQEIVRYAREHGSDLIVLAWRGTLDAERAAVARVVIREAPCPILILRVHEHPGTQGGARG